MRRSGFRVLALAGTLLPILAQSPTALTPGIAHITAVKGRVSIRYGSSGNWTPVVLNAPLATDDFVATEPGARADVQLDSTNTLRLTGSGEIRFVRCEDEHYEVALGKGAIVYRVTGPSQAIAAVDTPSVSVAPSREGVYRIGLNRAGESEIRADEGDVLVYAPSGSMWVNEGQKLWARGSAIDPEFRIANRRRLWRRMAQILGNIQLAAGSSGSSESASSSSAKSSATKSNSTDSDKSGASARATPHPSHSSESPKSSASHQSSSHATHNDGGAHGSHNDGGAHASHSESSSHASSSANSSSSSNSHGK